MRVNPARRGSTRLRASGGVRDRDYLPGGGVPTGRCRRVASPEKPLPYLRRNDDEECEPDADEPLAEGEVHGVQDPLEETELRCEDDCRERHPGEHQELAVLEEVEVEERAPLVERCKREEEVRERERREAHGACQLYRPLVAPPPDDAKRRRPHHEASDREPHEQRAREDRPV